MKMQIMGVLNITPDSSYDGGRYIDPEKAVKRAFEIYEEGADILDLGAESTWIDAQPLSEEEELKRVALFFNHLPKDYPLPISIDTYKPRVTEFALSQGATWINDITGFTDPEMIKLAGASKAKLCVMHMQGTPQTMQKNPSYPDGVIPHLKKWFNERIECLLKAGVNHEQITLDPGIGFGKNVGHNLTIYHHLNELKTFGCPILIGGSRKSFMRKILQKEREELLHPTLIMHTLAATNGADIFRVHDIKEHVDLIKLLSRSREAF